jgi:predicted AlkP superfamily phosphohydrolase/phosphomutase
MINWNKSDAIGSGQGPVYILSDQNQSKFETVRNEIIQKLEMLETPRGKPVANSVHKGEEVYSGKYMSEAPDIMIDQSNGIHINGNIGGEEIFRPGGQGNWRAENKRSGMFVAAGPKFSDNNIGTISILDLAPTILHMYNMDIPDSLDGKVKKEAYLEGSDPDRRQITHTNTQIDEANHPVSDDDLEQKLEDLGYL